MDDTTKRKLLSALCHGSIFFSGAFVSVAVPVVILFVSDDPVIQANAKEALNFHFNIWIYWIIGFVLSIVLIGIAILWIVQFISTLMPIIAIIQVLSNPEKSYRYPFIFHWL